MEFSHLILSNGFGNDFQANDINTFEGARHPVWNVNLGFSESKLIHLYRKLS